MLAWTPPELAAAAIPIVPRTAECTISRSLADTEVFSARGRAMASAAGVEEASGQFRPKPAGVGLELRT